MDLSILEERIDYHFKNKALLTRAVTHRSFAAEHNERLEFLGDSVLNCVVGHALFLRDTHYTEGVLSRTRANFVCEKTLDEIAAEIKIGEFIRLGEGELKTGGASRPSIRSEEHTSALQSVDFGRRLRSCVRRRFFGRRF